MTRLDKFDRIYELHRIFGSAQDADFARGAEMQELAERLAGARPAVSSSKED